MKDQNLLKFIDSGLTYSNRNITYTITITYSNSNRNNTEDIAAIDF